MADLTPAERLDLIYAIASKEYKATELASEYETTVDWLRKFVEQNRLAIEIAHEAIKKDKERLEESNVVTPTQLDELWISNKFLRLYRYQIVADHLYEECLSGVDSTALREFRSYLMAAANELGQLLHRGAGDVSDDKLNVDIQGVDLDQLR